MSTHYEVLGVNRKSSRGAVRKAYERRMKALAKDPDAFQEKIVKDAYAVLSNPVKRIDYDSRLGESEAMPAGAGSGVPLLVGFVVVALTAGAIGYFLIERSKDQTWMKQEDQRAAEEREKAKRKPAAPDAQQPAKR